MSTTTTVNNIISKLLSQPNKSVVLYLNGPRVAKQIETLKTRVNKVEIEETAYRSVAAFLQNINLNLFTDEELEVMLKFDYTFLENEHDTSYTKQRNLSKPYYDLDGTIINMSIDEELQIDSTFKELHATNKTLSVGFFASFLTIQV